MAFAVDTGSDQTSATELVAAPAAGRRIRVYGVQAFSDTQMTLTFTANGTDPVIPVAANGGFIMPPLDSNVRPYWDMEAATALTYTASVAGVNTVIVQYEIQAT